MDIGSSNVFRGFTGSRILVKVVNSLCFSMQTSIHISHFETTAGKCVAGNACDVWDAHMGSVIPMTTTAVPFCYNANVVPSPFEHQQL